MKATGMAYAWLATAARSPGARTGVRRVWKQADDVEQFWLLLQHFVPTAHADILTAWAGNVLERHTVIWLGMSTLLRGFDQEEHTSAHQEVTAALKLLDLGFCPPASPSVVLEKLRYAKVSSTSISRTWMEVVLRFIEPADSLIPLPSCLDTVLLLAQQDADDASEASAEKEEQ